MSYQVLARKYRPKNFESLVGQEHVVRALTHALEQQRLHHAYLFTGTRGVGKTTLSRILAKSLNCEKGITAHPCGECDACRAIDAGRFVDYIEMDAASNRGVDEMAQLLEQAVYAPTNARFKVYMIDEVHMLTNHAFNAMLKTLEEPPEHVKFILATTDPQKIPVTVLSRCLQFNLKQMPAGHIISHLDNILQQENIAFETPALRLLAQGAHGSMRDALSLTDQAIAYAAGTVTLDAVQSMLGTLDQSYLIRILDALSAKEGQTLLAVADEMAERSLSYHAALQDLGTLLHQIAIAQTVPEALSDDIPHKEDILRLAQEFTPEEIQLFYQIVVHGRQELGLAPDEYAGFSMTLLRLLAFIPVSGNTNTSVPLPKPAASVASPKPAAPKALVAPQAATQSVPVKENVPNTVSHADVKKNTKLSPAKAALEAARAAAANMAAHQGVRTPSSIPAAQNPVEPVKMAAVTSHTEESTPPWSQGERAVPQSSQNTSNDDDIPPWVAFAEDEYAPAATAINDHQVAEPKAAPAPVKMQTAASDQSDVAVLDKPKPVVPVTALKLAPLTATNHSSVYWDGNWPQLMASLPLRAVAQQLARESEFVREEALENGVHFYIRVPVETLRSAAGSEQKLADALTEKLGCHVLITSEIGEVAVTANAKAEEERAIQLKRAEEIIVADPFVQKLMQEFDAHVIEGSIRPV